ncbi:MAG TPA: TraR/DksA C4-type zinc finger protein [Acidimicrobiales bacterium]|nr:TraR/DksA C4-type zinc finger protein [Acidimicrobiales bacterium]
MTSSTASAIPHVDDDFLLGQRRELTGRRAAYREQVERLAAAADELAQAQAGEAPDLGDDEGFAEGDSLHVERDRVLSLTAVARRRIDEVDAALHRLDAGTYGACRSCRRPIPVARLEAVPEATQCVSCASGSALRRR